MPIPIPRSGEKAKDFHNRCMAAIGHEYKDNEGQANAICYSTWREHHKKKSESFIDLLKEFTSATLPLASQPVLESSDGPRKKKSKAEAIYVKHPVNGDECGDCTMFRAPGNCTQVEGTISPNGHCKYFEAIKKGKKFRKQFRRIYAAAFAKAHGGGSGNIPEEQARPIDLPIADEDVEDQVRHIAWERVRNGGSPLTNVVVSISDIVATQKVVDERRVEEHAAEYAANGKYKETPICLFLNSKYYILDGHHRVEGAKEAGAEEIEITFINGDEV
jgi:hypothetical protein